MILTQSRGGNGMGNVNANAIGVSRKYAQRGAGMRGIGQYADNLPNPALIPYLPADQQAAAWAKLAAAGWNINPSAGTAFPPSAPNTSGGPAGCFAGGYADNMNQWLSSLSMQSPTDAAVGCGSGGGTPCASAADAAQMAVAISKSWCQESNNQAQFGCVADPNCGDGGVAAAQPYVAAALQLFNEFPASVWATEAANAASGQYYGAGDTGGSDAGPKVNIITGAPIGNPNVLSAPPSTPSNALTPPSTAPAVAPGTVVQNQSGSGTTLGPNAAGTTGTNTPAPTATDLTVGGVDVVSWIQANWVILAAAAGALVVLGMMPKGRG